MSLQRLETLCQVAESGGIMAAARGEPSRQSLISRQIKELESALGFPLLERSSTPFQLTAAGKRVARVTTAYLFEMGSLLDESQQQMPRVKLGAGESIIQWLVIPALSKLGLERECRLTLQNQTSRRILEWLDSGRLDVGLVSSFTPTSRLASEGMGAYGVILIGKKGVLTRKKRSKLRWGDLGDVGLAVMEGQGDVAQRIGDLCTTHPDGPRVQLECSSVPQLIEVCLAGRLLGIVPELAAKAAMTAGLERYCVTELEDLRIHLSLVWRRNEEREGVRKVLAALKGWK